MSDSQKHQGEHTDGIEEGHNRAPNYFNVLFYGLIIWGTIFCAYFLLSGWSSDTEFQEKMAAHTGVPAEAQAAASEPTTTETPAVKTDAKALYASKCAGCHGADGSGGFGSDLTAASYKHGKSPDAIRESINTGRDGGMPGFSGQLSTAETDALVDYLLQL